MTKMRFSHGYCWPAVLNWSQFVAWHFRRLFCVEEWQWIWVSSLWFSWVLIWFTSVLIFVFFFLLFFFHYSFFISKFPFTFFPYSFTLKVTRIACYLQTYLNWGGNSRAKPYVLFLSLGGAPVLIDPEDHRPWVKYKVKLNWQFPQNLGRFWLRSSSAVTQLQQRWISWWYSITP